MFYQIVAIYLSRKCTREATQHRQPPGTVQSTPALFVDNPLCAVDQANIRLPLGSQAIRVEFSTRGYSTKL